MNQVYLTRKNKYVYMKSYICNNMKQSLIIFPNLGWYHVGPNRMFTQLADFCNQKNINVFCFDYIGTGESSGSYVDISWETLMESCLAVLEYVKKWFQGQIFVLGYGIGNQLLNKICELFPLDGVIFYLPEFQATHNFNKLFSDEEIMDAKRKGFFNIKVENNNKHLFYRTFVGGFHDCTYNPIPYALVEELSKRKNTLHGHYNGNQLYIVDQLEDSKDWKTEYYYVSEFKENIIPNDWYKKPNLWPDILYRVNKKIVDWIKSKNEPTNKVMKQDSKLKEVDKNIMRTDCIEREVVTIPSGDNILSGILHRPLEVKNKLPCVIFLPGLGGDKVDNFMCGPRLGDLFSKNDFILFRYDNRFSGSSKNSLKNFTWSEVFEDFHNVYQYLKTHYKIINFDQLFFISWSAGAKVANHIISNSDYKIKGGCYWNPVFLDGITLKKDSKKVLGKNNTRFTKNSNGELVTQIGGENLGMAYYRDSKKYNFKEEFDHIVIPLSFIWGSKDITAEEFQYIEGIKKELMYQVFIVKSKHHLFSYEQLEYIHHLTLNWIKSKTEHKLEELKKRSNL